MKKITFEKIAILGLGLIGGSIGLEIKKRKLAKVVVGYNRSLKGRRAALRRRACDRVFSQASRAVLDADLVILAGPVRVIPNLAKEISENLKPGAIVTDVGSSKELLVRKLTKILPDSVYFVPGHPIAGREHSGMEAAQLNLFQDRWWLLTPSGKGRGYPQAIKKVRDLVQALGAKVALLAPQEHDAALALISHLPHMVAYALVHTALSVQKGKALRFSGGGFRDFTRIAISSPEMWTDICLDNRKEILKVLGKFEKSLSRLKRFLDRSDAKGLRQFFSSVAKVRSRL